MRVLVTGAPGFVGRHMAAELLRAGHDVILTGVKDENINVPGFGRHPVIKMDITRPDDCQLVMSTQKPDAVIHLAGIAQTVGQSPDLFRLVNITGTGNVAKALLNSEIDRPKTFLFASSAFVFGGDARSGTIYCNETTPAIPRGDYGAGKLEAERQIAPLHGKNLRVYVARPFNHIGPGQDLSFVVPGLARKIRNASRGSLIETGNMNALRDFTDVRDVVRAYRLIIEISPDQSLFVIGSGRSTAIQQVFDYLNLLSGKDVRPSVSDHLKRDEGTAAILADCALAKKVLGWTPEIPLEQSLRDVWNDSK